MISSLWNDRVRSEVVYSNMCCRENRTVRDRGTQLMNDWTVYHPACPTACQQEELKKEKIHEILSVQDLNYHLYQSVLWEGSLTHHMRVICSVGERRTNWHSPVPPECQWKGDRRTVYYLIQWYTNMNISSWQRFTIVMYIYTVWGKVWSKELWISIWSLEIEKKRAIQIVLQFYYGSEGPKECSLQIWLKWIMLIQCLAPVLCEIFTLHVTKGMMMMVFCSYRFLWDSHYIRKQLTQRC